MSEWGFEAPLAMEVVPWIEAATVQASLRDIEGVVLVGHVVDVHRVAVRAAEAQYHHCDTPHEPAVLINPSVTPFIIGGILAVVLASVVVAIVALPGKNNATKKSRSK